MDHAAAREVLELAAVEPDGLERLMAGDTAEAAALAGHLAGCGACSEEMVRLRRTAILLRDVVGTTPTRELRGRTLDYVRAVGRPRGALAATSRVDSSDSGTPELVVDAARPAGASASVGEGRRGRLGPGPSFGLPRVAAWAASLAAAVIVSVAL